MERFVAIVEFEFESDRLESVGPRLRALARIARDADFELKRSRVEPVVEQEDGDDESGGWTRYAP